LESSGPTETTGFQKSGCAGFWNDEEFSCAGFWNDEDFGCAGFGMTGKQ
jgi:hypothetical protein